MAGRTIAIGDIHGDLAQLEIVLRRLPALDTKDTVVFLGDYVDRGPDARGVIDRIHRFVRESPTKTVVLRGNHEDLWIRCRDQPEAGFLLNWNNGCGQTFRSLTGGPRLPPEEGLTVNEIVRFFDVKSWLPDDVVDWMKSLPLWYEDDHAIYVHAGLDGEGTVWKHPRESREKNLMWMREPDFFTNYRGKRLVFGHTTTIDLPLDHLGPIARFFDDPFDVWRRGDLLGIDTGCGKGGFLSAVELPRQRIYESR
jgi:serine/threonine protein phosphatase 1